MRRGASTVVMAAIVVIGLAVAVSAQRPAAEMRHAAQGNQAMGQMGHGAGQMAHGRGMGPMAQLNLTDEQKQQVQQLMADAQTRHQGVAEQMRKLHDQLKAQIFADGGPGGGVQATVQQIAELQASMIRAHVEMQEQVSKLLTPEQRKKMREMPGSGMMGMRSMGGPRMHRQPPAAKK